jgi:4'-phosphopantetheinyl transferase
MLGPRDVAVFFARPETVEDAGLLDDAEHARLARFRFDVHRQEALASRVLQRRALSACAPGVDPADWVFAAGPHGKPAIASPASPLRFNVSNTRGLVGCAVTLGRELGFDLEPTRDDAPAEVVESHFAPVERAALRALAAAAQPRRFVELWTQKEAYLKALGVGLGDVPLDSFWFAPALVAPDAARWQVELWTPTDGHVAALCVARDDEGPLAVTTHWL